MALVVVFVGIFVLKGISPKETNPQYSEDMIADTEDLLPNEVNSEKKLYGSCNLIERGSTCIEYLGPYWNEQAIKLACKEGTFSKKGCPEQALGGCRINPESETDMITWHYSQGPGGFNEESIQYAKQACNSVPGGLWTEED